ncbi:MAG: BACON domain-containing carbohydrate-binding protein [Candidatus Aminicenantes bacterium]|jgi:hypothetical protein
MKSPKILFLFFVLLLSLSLLAHGQRINLSRSSGESFWPALAVNPDGVIMAIFTEELGGYNDIYCTLSYDGGNTWTTPERTYSRRAYIKACALDADKYGNFHMCYSDGYGSGGREVYYRYYVGGNWQAPEQLSFSTDNSNWCRISADGDEVHVIWYQEIGWPIKPYIALKSKPIGGTWPVDTVDVSRNPSNGAISPDVKAKDGNIYAVYRVQIYNGETLLGKYIGYSERINGVWNGPVELGRFNWPDIDVDEYDNVHCLYPNGSYVVYRAKINGFWQEEEWLNDGDGIACFFDVKYGSNTLIAAYMCRNNPNTDNYSIFYSTKEYQGGWGQWSQPIELDPGQYAELPKVAISNDGKAHIIWVDVGNAGEMDIYYKRLGLPSQDSPTIQLDKSSMLFSAIEGTAAESQTFQVRNSGISTLNYGISTDQSWLSVSPQSGSSEGEWDQITVNADASALDQGEYTGTITISSQEASNSPREITVTFRVSSEEPSIVLDKDSLLFSHTKGSSNPPPKQFKIRNAGLGSLTYQINPDRAWVTVNPLSGTSTGEWDTINVTVDAESLSRGNHSATITITSTDADNSPQYLSVSVSVAGGDYPAIQLDKTSLSFIYSNNAPLPPPQKVRIRNASTGTLNYQITSNKKWLVVAPTAGSSTGEWDDLTVSISYTGPLTENQTGTLSVTSSNATNSPQTITVNLRKQSPTIQLNRTSLSFEGVYREANPEAKEFKVKNSGTETLNYKLTSNRSWLNVTPRQGKSTGEWDLIRVRVDTASLGLGSYEGRIAVTSLNAQNSPQHVTIYLTVRKPNHPYPPANAQCQRIDHVGLFIKIYLNRITWEKNPWNADIYDITKFFIFRKLASQPDSQYVWIGKVNSGEKLEFEDKFSERALRDNCVYAVAGVTPDGNESPKVTIAFNTKPALSPFNPAGSVKKKTAVKK